MMGFDPEADYPYPEDEFARAVLYRLYHRHRTVDRCVTPRLLTYHPYDPETGEVRSAFDEIWESAIEGYSIEDGPETWTFHAGPLTAYPDEEVTGWHDLPDLDLSSFEDWEGDLPRVMSPGKVFACTRCTFTSHREDRARKHDREDHPGENASVSQHLATTPHFEAVTEENIESRGIPEEAGEGQHSFEDFLEEA